MVNSKVRVNIIVKGNFNMEVQPHSVNTYLENLKEVPFTNNSKQVPLASMTLIHPVVRKLFTEEIPNVPLAGRLSQFVKQWEEITRDQEILSIVKGYQRPFTNLPVQEKPQKMSDKQSLLVDQEISELLEKGAIQEAETAQEEFLSNIFLVGKKNGGDCPVINLKKLNAFIPYEPFKMEGLHCLKFLLEQNDLLCKIDLKDAYFAIPLSKQSSKCVRFKWSGNLYEFLCLCFGLAPVPKVFIKLLIIPIYLLRRINIRIIVYLDDMLLIGRTLQEIVTERDTLIFLLQKFEVCHKSEKVNPTISETTGISGVTDQYRGIDTVSLRRKTDSYNSTMSGGSLSIQNFSAKFDKVNCPTFVNGPSYIARENSISFS